MLLLELVAHPDELFFRLKSIWDKTDGHYLGLLDVICRLATDTLNRDSGNLIQARLEMPPDSALTAFRAYSKRLKEHSVLLRRLVRIAGLTIDYKALMGASMLGDEGALGKGPNAQADTAYAEIRRVVGRDNLSSLVKLAARIPGLTVSLMYKAYTEKVLTGLDPLLSEEEARMDAESRLSHRLFVAEPYMEKVGPVGLAGLIVGLCSTATGDWCGVQNRINLVVKSLQIMRKTESRTSGPTLLRKPSHEEPDVPPQERLERLLKLLRVFEKMDVMGLGSQAVSDLQGLWNTGEQNVAGYFIRLIKDGKLLRPGDVQELMVGYAMSLGSTPSPGEDVVGPLYVAAVQEALMELQSVGTPESLASLRRTLTAIVDDERLWSQVAPMVQSFISDEDSEDSSGSLHHARSDVLLLCAELHRPLVQSDVGSSEDVSTLLAFNRAAELLAHYFQTKVSRKQLSNWDGRLEIFHRLLPVAQANEGQLRALIALVKIWTDPSGHSDMTTGQTLAIPYGWWIKVVMRRLQGPQIPPSPDNSLPWVPLGDDQASSVPEAEGKCWRGLVEMAIRGGHINLISDLLLSGSWRYANPPLLAEDFEAAIVGHLEKIQAPLQIRLKVGDGVASFAP